MGFSAPTRRPTTTPATPSTPAATPTLIPPDFDQIAAQTGWHVESDGRVYAIENGAKSYIPPWIVWQASSSGKDPNTGALTKDGYAHRIPGSDPNSVWHFMYSEGGPFTNRSQWDASNGTYQGSIDWLQLLTTIGAGGVIGAGIVGATAGGTAGSTLASSSAGVPTLGTLPAVEASGLVPAALTGAEITAPVVGGVTATTAAVPSATPSVAGSTLPSTPSTLGSATTPTVAGHGVTDILSSGIGNGMTGSTWETLLPYIMKLGGSALDSALAPSPYQHRDSFQGGPMDPTKLLGESKDLITNALSGVTARANAPVDLPDAKVAPLGTWGEPPSGIKGAAGPTRIAIPGLTPTANAAPPGVNTSLDPQTYGAAQLLLHAMTGKA